MNDKRHHPRGGGWSRLRSAVLILCCATTALACKYNVRDVGFVDLENRDYRLVVTPGSTTPAVVVDTLRHTAGAVFLDSNVAVEFAAPGSGTELGMRLVSPDGQTLPLPWAPGEMALADAAWAALEAAVSSKVREELLGMLPSAYAVVLLSEGTDAGMNGIARAATERAIKQVVQLMPDLPKQVAVPPQLMVLSREQAGRERVLLWSMGVDLGDETDPSLVILYGRGRRVGPVLNGALITQTEVYRSLAVLGQDCECELDRSWMRGPLMPLRWDADSQSQVLKHLGFDAEHPLVKAEVSRILARGPGANARPVGLTREGLVNTLGYVESDVDLAPAGASEATEVAGADAPPQAGGNGSMAERAPSPTPTSAAKTGPANTSEKPTLALSWGVLGLVALVGIGGGLAILFFRRDS